MAAAVMALDRTLPALAPMGRLCLLVPFGAAVYAALLLLFARPLVEEMLAPGPDAAAGGQSGLNQALWI